jgi:hypothetical protein
MMCHGNRRRRTTASVAGPASGRVPTDGWERGRISGSGVTLGSPPAGSLALALTLGSPPAGSLALALTLRDLPLS